MDALLLAVRDTDKMVYRCSPRKNSFPITLSTVTTFFSLEMAFNLCYTGNPCQPWRGYAF
jgi:hypothetical protein